MRAVRDHYQVLGITESFTDDELKKAYRKLALLWHPDKNPHREDEAKQEFQFIQAAYDTLSDPQERAWYDRHKEAILNGFGRDYKDDSVDIMPYFNSSCYSGFDDSLESFYSVYRDLFTRIASEDLKFKDEEDATFEVPSFGFSNSAYDEIVGPFYAYWQSYCTSKPFTWLDKYDIREADNRRILRLMEKENKKVRDQAKKERNEEVRSLVAFVRKRDKRLQAQKKLLEEKAAENARRAEENRQKQLAERLVLLEETREARRLHMTEVESQLKEIEASLANEHGDVSSEEDSIVEDAGSQNEDVSSVISGEDMYCPACNKLFKTAKAFHNHENSKRHKENVKRLRLDLLEDEEAASEEDAPVIIKEDLKSEKPIEDELESDVSLEEEKQEKKKAKKNKKKQKAFEFKDDSDVENTEKLIGLVDGGFSDEDNGRKKKGKKTKISKKQGTEIKEPKVEIAEEVPKVEADVEIDENKPVETPKQKGKKTEKDTCETKSLECVKCKSSYPSKNKLFEHLKASGHAIYVPKDVEVPKGKKSRKEIRRKQEF